MVDEEKSKEQLIEEISALRGQIEEFQHRQTVRKDGKESLRFLDHDLRSIIEYAADGFFVHDFSGKFLDVNRRACEFLGYTREELLKLSVPHVEMAASKEMLLDTWKRMAPGVPMSFEGLSKRKDGTVFPSEIRVSRVGCESGLFLALVRDVTDRKQAENELRRARNDLELRVGQRTADLKRAYEQLRSLSSRLIAVQEEERNRLACELHDSIGQTLAALKFNVEFILAKRDRGDPKGALEHLEQFVPILQRSIDETRAIYTGLRPRMLEEMGLVVTLQWFCRESMALYPKRHIELMVGVEEEAIPESLKITIFRIIQEALNNIAKHSRAEWVDLSLMRNCEGIELTIADDGSGMDLDFIMKNHTPRSLGLTSMRERAELTGGSFFVESTPGEGTIVRAAWKVAAINK